MTASATITSKGQITLPKAIREHLRVREGDRVSFREREDGSVVVEAASVDLLSLVGMVKPRRRGVTLEGIREVTRGSRRR